MSNIVAREFDSKEISLIRDTVAKNASKEEFELFLYRCKNMGLDPLKPGQIFFIKYGSSPGTIVVGREGFRVRASKTGKHTGTKLGTLRDESGKCIGAWCEVYRSDWQHPARVEVSLSEYNTGKSQWAKMPETMIQKVAEAAALRMAFPDELGGIYISEEMDQASDENQSRDVGSNDEPPKEEDPRAYRIGGGVMKGRSLAEVIEDKGLPALQNYIARVEDLFKKDNKAPSPWLFELKVQLGRWQGKQEPFIGDADLSAEDQLEVDRMSRDMANVRPWHEEDFDSTGARYGK
jgi:phage recombination protein Bet